MQEGFTGNILNSWSVIKGRSTVALGLWILQMVPPGHALMNSYEGNKAILEKAYDLASTWRWLLDGISGGTIDQEGTQATSSFDHSSKHRSCLLSSRKCSMTF